MTIIREKRTKNYTIINNSILDNNRLSFKARGLLIYMLSKPDDWKFYELELEKHSQVDGQSAIKSALKEIERTGYLKRQRSRENGKFIKTDWILAETPDVSAFSPQVEKPFVDNPPMEKPPVDNQPLLSIEDTKNLNNKGLKNKDRSNKFEPQVSFDKLWTLYPKKIGKQNALKEYTQAIKQGTTDAEIKSGIENYVQYIQAKHVEYQFIKTGYAWFRQQCWLDEYDTTPIARADRIHEELPELVKTQIEEMEKAGEFNG